MVHARNKGNKFERDTAKTLSDAFPPIIFKRVPLSGGWDKESVSGDISPWIGDVIPYFAFNVECKNDKSLSLRPWLRQSRDDCRDRPITPIVIFHVAMRKGLRHGADLIAIGQRQLKFYMKRGSNLKFNDYTSQEKKWKLEEWILETFSFTDDKHRAFFLNFEGETIVVLRYSDFLSIIDKGRVCSRFRGVLLQCLLSSRSGT